MTPASSTARASLNRLRPARSPEGSSLLRDRCFVDGAWVGTPSIKVDNPATGATIISVPRFGAKEATDAVEAARTRLQDLVEDHRQGTCRAAAQVVRPDRRQSRGPCADPDLGAGQAADWRRAGEIDIGGAYVEFFSEEARKDLWRDHSLAARRRAPAGDPPAIGVAGAITPWNFPCSMITRKVSPALAAGCTVVLKPATETPLTALALAALAEKAGFPKGVFNVLTGESAAIGKVLCEHPAVRVIGFTGSTEVGKILYKQAAVGIKKLGLELGGNAPFIVFDDADLDAAVEGAMVSKFRNMGQTCVCANRLYAQDKIYDAFVEKLAGQGQAMKVGDGTEDGVTQGPLINANAVKKVEEHIADAVSHGAKVVTGGKAHALGGTFFDRRCWPTCRSMR